MTGFFHKIKVKLLCWRGKALDIHSKGEWPTNMLSNFYPHNFTFDGIRCGSLEGFLQSLKTNDLEEQIQICALSGKEAKSHSTDTWKQDQTIYWKGQSYYRQGDKYIMLLHRAYRAALEQCKSFRDALAATDNVCLFHTIGNPNACDTILTENELCSILEDLRRNFIPNLLEGDRLMEQYQSATSDYDKYHIAMKIALYCYDTSDFKPMECLQWEEAKINRQELLDAAKKHLPIVCGDFGGKREMILRIPCFEADYMDPEYFIVALRGDNCCTSYYNCINGLNYIPKISRYEQYHQVGWLFYKVDVAKIYKSCLSRNVRFQINLEKEFSFEIAVLGPNDSLHRIYHMFY